LGLAAFLASKGHTSVAFDLDGHGANQHGLSSPFMEATTGRFVETLASVTGFKNIAVVGFGLGGLAAVKCAGDRSEVLHAAALDPTALESDGSCAINALRELDILDVLRSALRPPAKNENGRRVSLSKLLSSMKVPENSAAEKVSIISTRETWLTSPASELTLASKFQLRDPVLVESNHYSLIHSSEAYEAILKIIRS
ncbi:MAG: alpha/beta hydrolase, partial [Actinobacteria bacterium]|nr:alpha/beta hydrolase [Actinomycetota bacterium]